MSRYEDLGVVGFTCSTFDLLHAGHLLMLEECRRNCDYLIVGIQTDPTIDRPNEKNKPIQSIVERQIQIKACKWVDEVVVYSTEKDLEDLLSILPIHKRFLGVEYEGKNFTGKEICNKRMINVVYNSRNHGYSSSSLRVRVFEAEMNKLSINTPYTK
jgi:glycerol-3-phosphate cytidylyltransferase